MTIFLTSKQISNLKSMTSINNHGCAYETAASYLGLDGLKEKFHAINRDHDRRGFLTLDMMGRRYALYQELMEEAKKKLSEEEYKKFYACF